MARANQRNYNVRYYARNRAAEIERVATRQAATRDYLRGLKAAECVDCGGSFAPQQLDFDHREPSSKSFWVMSGRAMLMSRARLQAEISKCDLVCANCHRVRTRDRNTGAAPLTGKSPYIARRRRYWRLQAAALNALRDVPCVDCGRRFAACAMDFDHLDSTVKDSEVMRMIGRAGMPRILAEVAKCEVVCANCHRLRTYNRRQLSIERE